MTKTTALSEIKDILKEIHELNSLGESKRVKSLRAEAHKVIIGSALTYQELYGVFKQWTLNTAEFNLVMSRVRETVLR